MLNLLKLKQEKAAAKEGGEEGAKSGGKVIPAAQRRVQKGVLCVFVYVFLRLCVCSCVCIPALPSLPFSLSSSFP